MLPLASVLQKLNVDFCIYLNVWFRQKSPFKNIKTVQIGKITYFGNHLKFKDKCRGP